MFSVLSAKKHKGFTLVEFLFVAFTLALFMTALFKITRGGLRAYQRGVVQTELKHELRNIMDRITTDVRQAQPGSFTDPARTYGPYDTHSWTADFRRSKYTADDTIPDASVQVVYTVQPFHSTLTQPDDYNYYVSTLTRAETESGTTQTISLSDNVVYAYNDPIIVATMFDSGFRWGKDPINPSNRNIDVLEVTMALAKTHSGSDDPEHVKSITKVALRTGKDLTAGSNYYPPSAASDPYANIQRFGDPTSLVRP